MGTCLRAEVAESKTLANSSGSGAGGASPDATLVDSLVLRTGDARHSMTRGSGEGWRHAWLSTYPINDGI
jgi:hypothetical protein